MDTQKLYPLADLFQQMLKVDQIKLTVSTDDRQDQRRRYGSLSLDSCIVHSYVGMSGAWVTYHVKGDLWLWAHLVYGETLHVWVLDREKQPSLLGKHKKWKDASATQMMRTLRPLVVAKFSTDIQKVKWEREV